MNLRVLVTHEDMARGVIGLPSIGADDVFFFAHIGRGDMFHMTGVPFGLGLAFLDRHFRMLELTHLEPQTGLAWAPPGSAFAAETSEDYFTRHGLRPGEIWTELRAALEAARVPERGRA